MFMMLVRKDFRLQLPVLIAAGLLFVAPAVIYLVVNTLIETPGTQPEPIALMLLPLLMGGLAAASLTIPAFAGVAAARERRERTAEFLEAMPVTRWKIVSSRGLVAAVCCALPALVGFTLMLGTLFVFAARHGSTQDVVGASQLPTEFFEVATNAGATLLAAAGVAWMVGSLLRSEVIAGALGIAVPIGIHAATYIAIQRLEIVSGAPEIHAAVAAGVAIPCLILGTVISLVRKSP
jgi:ABC-type transport system involved in multi-copper enzyme maturation permease subunit